MFILLFRPVFLNLLHSDPEILLIFKNIRGRILETTILLFNTLTVQIKAGTIQGGAY
jgi:hypothetical protein